jgi:hypothetical protein
MTIKFADFTNNVLDDNQLVDSTLIAGAPTGSDTAFSFREIALENKIINAAVPTILNIVNGDITPNSVTTDTVNVNSIFTKSGMLINVGNNVAITGDLSVSVDTILNNVTINGTSTFVGGIVTDSVTARTTNGDLTLAGNGTGSVVSNSTFKSDNITSSSSNTNLVLSGNGTGIVESLDDIYVDNIVSRSTNTNLTLSGNGTGIVESLDNIHVDNISARTTNSSLTLSGNGTGIVKCSTNFQSNDISSFTSNTNLSLSGSGSGIVQSLDDFHVNNILARSSNTNLSLSGNGTGIVSSSSDFHVNNISARSSNTSLALSGNGTGIVTTSGNLRVGNTLLTDTISGITNNGILNIDTIGVSSKIASNSAWEFGEDISVLANLNVANITNEILLSDILIQNTSGNVRIFGSGTELRTNTIRADETNGDLNLAGNGTGNVVILDDLFANTFIGSRLSNGDLTLKGGTTTGDVIIDPSCNLLVDTIEPASGTVLTLNTLSTVDKVLSNKAYVMSRQNGTQTISNGTDTALTFNLDVFDPDSYHSQVTNNSRFNYPNTKTVSARWICIVQMVMASSNSNRWAIYFAKNGAINPTTDFRYGYFSGTGWSAGDVITCSSIIQVDPNDYIEAYVWQNSGGSTNCSSSNLTSQNIFYLIEI